MKKDNAMKAEMFCYSSKNGKYLSYGDCIEKELWKHLQQAFDFEWAETLRAHISKQQVDNKQHWQDVLYVLFRANISISYEFAEKLRLFDIIYPECFDYNGLLGMEMQELLTSADLLFIVSQKCYTRKESISINFEVCHVDFEYNCHKDVITQSIY